MECQGRIGAAILGFYAGLVCCRKQGLDPQQVFDLVRKECFMYEVGELVKFKSVNNARGYPLTGTVEAIRDNGTIDVKAFGLIGPGADSMVSEVPPEDLEKCGSVAR